MIWRLTLKTGFMLKWRVSWSGGIQFLTLSQAEFKEFEPRFKHGSEIWVGTQLEPVMAVLRRSSKYKNILSYFWFKKLVSKGGRDSTLCDNKRRIFTISQFGVKLTPPPLFLIPRNGITALIKNEKLTLPPFDQPYRTVIPLKEVR